MPLSVKDLQYLHLTLFAGKMAKMTHKLPVINSNWKLQELSEKRATHSHRAWWGHQHLVHQHLDNAWQRAFHSGHHFLQHIKMVGRHQSLHQGWRLHGELMQDGVQKRIRLVLGHRQDCVMLGVVHSKEQLGDQSATKTRTTRGSICNKDKNRARTSLWQRQEQHGEQPLTKSRTAQGSAFDKDKNSVGISLW